MAHSPQAVDRRQMLLAAKYPHVQRVESLGNATPSKLKRLALNEDVVTGTRHR